MKVKVKERFIDAKTGRQLQVGEVIDVSDERAKVMAAANLAEICITTRTSSKGKKPKA